MEQLDRNDGNQHDLLDDHRYAALPGQRGLGALPLVVAPGPSDRY